MNKSLECSSNEDEECKLPKVKNGPHHEREELAFLALLGLPEKLGLKDQKVRPEFAEKQEHEVTLVQRVGKVLWGPLDGSELLEI